PKPLAPYTATIVSVILRSSIITHKAAHRGLTFRTDTVTHQHLLHCQEQNLDIQPQRAVVHIPYVELELLIPAERVSAIYLSPARYPRAHLMPTILLS